MSNAMGGDVIDMEEEETFVIIQAIFVIW